MPLVLQVIDHSNRPISIPGASTSSMAPYIPPPPPPPPPNDVAGGLTAGFFVVIVLLCLLCLHFFLRSRADRKRMEERTAAFFRVRGVIQPGVVEPTFSPTSALSPFDRVGVTPSIVIPEKSMIRKAYSHGLSDKAVRLGASPASSTSPFKQSLADASPHPYTVSILSSARHSRSSSGFSTYTQSDTPPGLTHLSRISSLSPLQSRPVRQHFEPALPDELAPRYGEGLTVLQCFDDGWCLVARDTRHSSRASYLSTSNGDKVDVGLVPAWVFVERLNGNSVTRPFRSSSADALHLVQHLLGSKNAVIPRSRFG